MAGIVEKNLEKNNVIIHIVPSSWEYDVKLKFIL